MHWSGGEFATDIFLLQSKDDRRSSRQSELAFAGTTMKILQQIYLLDAFCLSPAASLPKKTVRSRITEVGSTPQVMVAVTTAERAGPPKTGTTKTIRRTPSMASTSRLRLMKVASLFFLAIAVLLSAGCSAIPGLRTPEPVAIGGKTIDAVIVSAKNLRAEYTSKVTLLAKDIEDSAKFKLIDGTALAAASLFGGNRNVLGFFGLAGGASIAVDGTFSPSAQLGTYEAGHAAISCMVDLALAAKSYEPMLQRFSMSRGEFIKSARSSLAISANETEVLTNNDGAEVPIERVDPLASVKNALSMNVEKGNQLVEMSESVDVVEIFKSNLVSLDQSVRKKIRGALKPQEATGVRDQLITQASEAQATREQAKQLEISIQAINSSQDYKFRDVNNFAGILSAAAKKATFDADLKKCAANVGA
jgi:hypothetical protein